MDKSVILITGALTGIGRAAAVAFAKKGAKLVVAGRRDEAGKALVKELRSFGSEAEFINADVRKEDDVRALVDKTVARFGRLDVAVNNAGTEGQVGPITHRRHHQVGGARDRQVGNPCERRGTWSYGHWHVDPLYGHAGEQGGPGEGCSDGSPRPL